MKSDSSMVSVLLAANPFWQRKYQSERGREYILMSMRHWLAGVLARERPVLFHQLPESFKVGLELPEKRPGGGARHGLTTQVTLCSHDIGDTFMAVCHGKQRTNRNSGFN
jgi:hypothetical protein